jgi:DNA-directed RNA polymerase sigma subunit (sigma70/sigma32)
MTSAHSAMDLSSLSIGSLVWMASSQPVLDEATEDQLIQRAGHGDRAALEQLAMSNLRIVIDEAIRSRGLGTPQDKLVRAGVRALVDAVRYYDPQRHDRFSSHVRSRVRAALNESVGVS